MFSHTVTFKDVEGNEASKTLYFNLSKDEMMDLELQHHTEGGFIKWFGELYANKHMSAAYDELKSLIDLAYGERNPDDPTEFDKSPAAKGRFSRNLARTAMIDALLSDQVLFTNFIKLVFPLEMLNEEEIEKALAEARAEVEKEQNQTDTSNSTDVVPS